MQKIFQEVNSLDKRCYEYYGLSEDILMEHAALALASFIRKKFPKKSKVLIVTGSGNNGADGIVLARLLSGDFEVDVYQFKAPKTPLGKSQFTRVKNLSINFINKIEEGHKYEIIVDSLLGTGLNGTLDGTIVNLLELLNQMDGYKIACDIPSGVNILGQVNQVAFQANTTITMGALKTALFLDEAKEYIGDIVVANLGLAREYYETPSHQYLLEKQDLKLPFRRKQNTHKGDFGHLAVIVGQKIGAGILCAKAGFTFGTGLVSIINHKEYQVPDYIMQSHKLPSNTTAIALGMGLGNYEQKEILDILELNIPKVIDADLFYSEDILKVLEKETVVLTPHPKEFCALLHLCNIATIGVEKLQKNRFEYVKRFSQKYPKVVLLLKGANTLIVQNETLYINTFGSSKLSFGGSGDVLSGLIGSLLAQGYSALDAAISGSLSHSFIALNYDKNDFSITPEDLIEGIRTL